MVKAQPVKISSISFDNDNVLFNVFRKKPSRIWDFLGNENNFRLTFLDYLVCFPHLNLLKTFTNPMSYEGLKIAKGVILK